MAKRLFGTDGVRGVANQELTPELALSLGRAAGAYAKGGRLLLGWDPRLSSDMLRAAFSAGVCSSGASVVEAGVIPTGILAMFVKSDGLSLGAMISASHNPAKDNGIKLIGPDGRKLSDDAEEQVEGLMDAPRGVPGTVFSAQDLLPRHLAYLKDRLRLDLAGMKVSVDCAHGAASAWAEPILRAFGAEVTCTGARPDGMNINAEGGATKPAPMQALTRDKGASVGLAFDGDADRVVFADEHGKLVNGDAAMALWALERKRGGSLEPAVVVGTVMSNMGMERYLAEEGIRLERAAVGDRYVVERMDATGALIGGEQSGHIVFSELAPTGDGILTALEILGVMASSGRPLSAASGLFQPWPQVLINVKVDDRATWMTPEVVARIEEGERALGPEGRLNVRASGTQPMLRIMCEHRDRVVRDLVAEGVYETLRVQAGGEIYSRVELTDALGD